MDAVWSSGTVNCFSSTHYDPIPLFRTASAADQFILNSTSPPSELSPSQLVQTRSWYHITLDSTLVGIGILEVCGVVYFANQPQDPITITLEIALSITSVFSVVFGGRNLLCPPPCMDEANP